MVWKNSKCATGTGGLSTEHDFTPEEQARNAKLQELIDFYYPRFNNGRVPQKAEEAAREAAEAKLQGKEQGESEENKPFLVPKRQGPEFKKEEKRRAA